MLTVIIISIAYCTVITSLITPPRRRPRRAAATHARARVEQVSLSWASSSSLHTVTWLCRMLREVDQSSQRGRFWSAWWSEVGNSSSRVARPILQPEGKRNSYTVYYYVNCYDKSTKRLSAGGCSRGSRKSRSRRRSRRNRSSRGSSRRRTKRTVSYTHLTLPTIYSV